MIDKEENINRIEELGTLIENGAKDFLYEEYKFCVAFLAFMAIVLYFACDLWDHDRTN